MVTELQANDDGIYCIVPYEQTHIHLAEYAPKRYPDGNAWSKKFRDCCSRYYEKK